MQVVMYLHGFTQLMLIQTQPKRALTEHGMSTQDSWQSVSPNSLASVFRAKTGVVSGSDRRAMVIVGAAVRTSSIMVTNTTMPRAALLLFPMMIDFDRQLALTGKVCSACFVFLVAHLPKISRPFYRQKHS
jgi:hypothetical protein